MAIFKPYRVQSSQLNSLPKVEGQFIIVEDTSEIYFDQSASERIAVGGLTDVDATINNGVLTLTDQSSNILSAVNIPRVIEAVSWNDESFPDATAFDTYSINAIDTMLNAKLDASLKGANNGVAELDANGQIPVAQIPTYAVANASVAGIAKLYTSTGNNTDGAMTQATVTNLIGDITNLMAVL